jgi:hypothetical protein
VLFSEKYPIFTKVRAMNHPIIILQRLFFTAFRMESV